MSMDMDISAAGELAGAGTGEVVEVAYWLEKDAAEKGMKITDAEALLVAAVMYSHERVRDEVCMIREAMERQERREAGR